MAISRLLQQSLQFTSMKYRLIVLTFFMSLLSTSVGAVSTEITSPQSMMIGARAMSLGGQNPVLVGDINSLFINPAVVADVQSMPFTVTSQKVLGAFDYLYLASSMPLKVSLPVVIDNEVYQQKLVLGLSYGSVGLDDIPRTERSSSTDVINETGSYGAGFRVLGASLGTTFYNKLGFDVVSTGLGLKAVSQYVDSSDRLGFGLDMGVIGRYNVDYMMVDRLYFGASAHNVLSTSLVYDDTRDRSVLPLELYVGARADLFNDRASVFLNNSLAGMSVGAEYRMEGFHLRASTSGDQWSLGTGLLFGQVSGFAAQTYNLRLDYNFSQNPAPFEDELTHALSLTVLGSSRPHAPRILQPKEDFLTSKLTVDLVGVGPKSTSIQIYNNDQLVRTAQTDHQGRWKFLAFPLKEGKNKVYVKSYDMEEEVSKQSDAILITTDTLPPKMDIAVYPDKKSLVVVALVDTDVDKMIGAIDDVPSEFNPVSPGVWEARFDKPTDLEENAPISTIMHKLDVAAADKAGNENTQTDIPFFATVEFPQDKFVHLKDRVRILGTASMMTKTISFSDQPVYIDKTNRFSFNYDLKPGKNLIKMKIRTLNDETLTQTIRVLRLKSFEDLTDQTKGRRAIELMATLGALTGDSKNRFNPTSYMTRKELARTIALATKMAINKTKTAAFTDVASDDPDAPYVQAMIENGIMVAGVTGRFGASDALSLNDILEAMSSAGMISQSSDPDIGEQLITKADLARYLSFLPEYEKAIEDLVNFEKGYR